jgi:hypothetical protein
MPVGQGKPLHPYYVFHTYIVMKLFIPYYVFHNYIGVK